MAAAGAELLVTAASAVTPVGLDVAESCAAIRAGLSGLGEHPYFLVQTRDPGWDEPEPLAAALVPGLDSAVEGPERLGELGVDVLRKLVARAGLRRADLRRTGLLVALPRSDEVVATWAADAFPTELCAKAGVEGFGALRADPSGHASMLRLMAEVGRLCETGQLDQCIVLGVDTHHSAARLEQLDAARRLRTERCPDGFLPGEAAVALLVEPARRGHRPALARLSLPGLGDEPRTLLGEPSSSGRGLAMAIESTLQAAGSRAPASWVLCDLNGESYRSFEWGLVRTRLGERFAPSMKLVHPAECVGDVGAASGGLLVACACQAYERGYAPASSALAWSSSEHGLRAALCVSAPS